MTIGAFATASRLSPKALRLVRRPGAPDNVACVVADVLSASAA